MDLIDVWELSSLSKDGNINGMAQLLQTTTLDQISETLNHYVDRQDVSLAQTVRLLFQGSPVADNNQAAAMRRLGVFKSLIGILQSQDLTNRMSSEVVGLLLVETDSLPGSCLAELVNVFIEVLKNKETINGKAFELFPKIISSLATKESVSYGNSTMKGTDYANHVINTLCSSRWYPHCLIHLATIFRDILLSSDQLKQILSKILRLCKDVDIQELPPLVYQLLLLSTKGHKNLVLRGIISYLVEQDRICKEQQDADSNHDSEALDAVSQETLRHMEGTIVLHITYAVNQDQDLGREFVKFLKAGLINDVSSVLAPFNIALALSVAKSHRFEEQIFDLLKNAILKCLKDEDRRKSSYWISELSPVSPDVTAMIVEAVQNSSYGWDHVVQGLIQLGFTLMDSFGPKAGAFGKSTEHLAPTNSPMQRACSLGCEILLSTFRSHTVVGPEILEQLLNRIVTKGTAPVSHYVGLLSNIVASSSQVLLNSLPKLRQALEYLSFLTPASAEGLLRAVQPLMKLNVALKDSLMMVLKKATFARQVDARKIAVSGYLQILKHFQLKGSISSNQLLSQSLSGQSLGSQTMVDVHTRELPQSSADYQAIVCLEILANLRRCFTQQADVRLILYEGVIDVLDHNSKLNLPILQALSKQWSNYYEPDVDLNPPIMLQKCVVVQGDDIILTEPLPYLLMSLCHCFLQCKKIRSMSENNEDDGGGEDDDEDDDDDEETQHFIRQLDDTLSSLTRRMVKSDLEDFELDKSASFSQATSVGSKNSIFAVLLLGIYENLIEYGFRNTDYSSDRADELVALFDKYRKLSDIVQEKSGQKGPKSTVKTAGCLLSIRFIARIQQALLSDELPNHQEFLHILLDSPDLLRYIITMAIKKVNQLNDRGYCDGPRGHVTESLYAFCVSVSRGFLRKFTSDAITTPDRGKKDKVRGISSLCLEGLSTSFHVICTRYPSRVADYLRAISPDDDGGDTIDDDSRVHLHIKKFQRLMMDQLTSGNETASAKEVTPLCNIIVLLSKQLKTQGPPFHQLYTWISKVCSEQNIEDVGLTKALMGHLFKMTRQSSSSSVLLCEVAQDIHSQLGDIDTDIEVEDTTQYAIINKKTAAPCITLLLISQIDTVLEEIEWVITDAKGDHLRDADLDNEAEILLTQQEDFEKSVLGRLTVLVNTLHELVQSAVPVGQCMDAVLKAVTRMYKTITLLIQYYLSLDSQALDIVPARFQKLIKLVGQTLTPKAYAMINYVQSCQSARAKATAAKSSKAKKSLAGPSGDVSLPTADNAKGVIRRTKSIPDLVCAIERSELFLIRLSKKSKVDLMEHVRLSTSRDFRIHQEKIQAALDRSNSSDSGNENSSDDDDSDNDDNGDEPPSKRSKVGTSPARASTSS